MNDIAIILAAGKGSRMKSDLPKCLHEVAGLPMVDHVINAAHNANIKKSIVVIGHGADRLENHFQAKSQTIQCVTQAEQLGTGHAVKITGDLLKDCQGIAVVLYGDTPLLSATRITELMEKARETQGVAILGFNAQNPNGYGRLIIEDNTLLAIREAKDANAAELEITACNSGVLAAPAKLLLKALAQLTNNNAQGEYYLTDIVEIARNMQKATSVIFAPEEETLGVNTPQDLAKVNNTYQDLKRSELLGRGIKMKAPDTVFFHHDTKIGDGVIIEPNVVFEEGVNIENDARIRAFSHLERAHIGKSCEIGPYARIRPGTQLGSQVKVGNFVETKNAVIHKGAKVNHLSYIGDAEIGENSNIGAGTITCNYDGVFKHKTTIGKEVFIGSNASLVAPLIIGDGAMTGSGSVITKNIDPGDLALGRSRQENKKGFATKLMSRLRQLKASK